MEYKNYIFDLLDGDISPENETQLFREFALNDELRTSFLNKLNVKLSLSKRQPIISVEASEKSSLFKKLGLAIPTIPTKNNVTKRLLPRKDNIFWAGASAIIVFLLTFFLFVPDSNIYNSSFSELTDKKQPIVEKFTTKYIPVSEKESLTMNEEGIEKSIAQKPISNHVYETKETVESTEVFSSFPEKINTSVSINTPENQISNDDKPVKIPNIRISENQNLATNNFESPENNFSLELCGSNYFFPNNILIGPKKWADFNNTDISIYYKLNQDLSIGLEYRRENFYLRYNVSENGIPMIYEQQPNFNTIALAFRYNPFRIGSLSPFIQLSAGGNNVGSVIRGGLGVKIHYSPMFDFILGADYSLMIFDRENTYYYSNKYGLKYGVIFKF